MENEIDETLDWLEEEKEDGRIEKWSLSFGPKPTESFKISFTSNSSVNFSEIV